MMRGGEGERERGLTRASLLLLPRRVINKSEKGYYITSAAVVVLARGTEQANKWMDGWMQR